MLRRYAIAREFESRVGVITFYLFYFPAPLKPRHYGAIEVLLLLLLLLSYRIALQGKISSEGVKRDGKVNGGLCITFPVIARTGTRTHLYQMHHVCVCWQIIVCQSSQIWKIIEASDRHSAENNTTSSLLRRGYRKLPAVLVSLHAICSARIAGRSIFRCIAVVVKMLYCKNNKMYKYNL